MPLQAQAALGREEQFVSYSLPSCKDRSEAVKQHLLRLAYSLSDIVVFVACVSLANNSIFDDCIAVGESASEGVTGVARPALFIVSNCCKLNKLRPIDEATASSNAKRTDRMTQLLSTFSVVRVVELPMCNDDPPSFVNGELEGFKVSW